MHYYLESLLASLPIDINLLVTIHAVALGSFLSPDAIP